eukprot:gene7376-7586_t
MRLEELVTVREIRAVIKEKFKEHKDVTDPRISEYLDPIIQRKTAFQPPPTSHSNEVVGWPGGPVDD